MNIFFSLHKGLSFTLRVIIIVTTLVLFEKVFSPKIQNWGDIYPALLIFFVILSKTVIPLVLLWKVYRLKPRALDWVEGGLFQAVWKGVVLAAFMLAFVFIYQRYSFLVFQAPYNSTSRHFLEQKVFNAVLGVTIFTALLNALGEEIIFRGMLMPALSPYMGVASILILQSLIFTVYHFFAFQNAVLLFIMGIFFGLGYIWSGSLLTPVLAHLIENGLPSLVFLVRL